MSKIVIALGGNALQNPSLPPTAEAQLQVIRETAKPIVEIIAQGHSVTLTHGNGPQIGRIVLQNETAETITPCLPFDVCGAMSQGMIGYLLQLAVGDEVFQYLVDDVDIGKNRVRILAGERDMGQVGTAFDEDVVGP